MRRLVAVSISESWTGGWQPAHGTEYGAVASPIGEGERVQLEVVDKAEVTHLFELSAEPTRIDHVRMVRYRVIKDCKRAVTKMPTTVEMILSNGRR